MGARGARVDPSTAFHALLTWSQLHGFVSLGISGNCASMSIDANKLFEAELSRLAS